MTARAIPALAVGLLAGCGTPSTPPDSTLGDGISATDSDTGCAATTWYLDLDGDGYGSAERSVDACEAPAGYATLGGDCDPQDATVHPGAAETCDGRDNDCDSALPDDEQDRDGDGQRGCEGDCDDTDAAVWAGAPERCDGVDNDCDGVTPPDEADDDNDGLRGCDGDCDDSDPTADGRDDLCGDGVDNDCDGTVDSDCGSVADFDWTSCDAIVPTDFATIQGAIDAATTGDLICVEPGTWYENLDFGGAALTVLGVGGPSFTTIDGASLGPVVTFAAAEGPLAVLDGFTLTHGYDSAGGGIQIIGASPTLQRLRIEGNEADWNGGGGGLYIEAGSPTLSAVVVSGNAVTTRYCGDDYGIGGGILVEGGDPVLESVVVEDNVSGEGGGGLYLHQSNAALVNVLVVGNSSGFGGGAGLYVEDSSPTLTNTIVAENVAYDYWSTSYGAGMHVDGGAPKLTNVVVANNTSANSGGGIYLSSGSLDLVNVVLTGNLASGGGAIYLAGGSVSFTNSDTWGNNPDDLAGLSDPTGTDGNLSVDPSFYPGVWQLDAGSALIDAGTAALADPDGSPSDMGAYGGPYAGIWDLDGDAWPVWWSPGTATSAGLDCDDRDPTVYPGTGC